MTPRDPRSAAPRRGTIVPRRRPRPRPHRRCGRAAGTRPEVAHDRDASTPPRPAGPAPWARAAGRSRSPAPPRGWAVVSPAGARAVARPGRGAVASPTWWPRSSAACRARPQRPPVRPRAPRPSAGRRDPRDARIAALERTVAQLEHALAARVATERAIGVLAERHGMRPARGVRGAAPRRPAPRAARWPSWPARCSTALTERRRASAPAPAAGAVVGAARPGCRTRRRADHRPPPRRTAAPDPSGAAQPRRAGRPAGRPPRRVPPEPGRDRAARRRRRPGRRRPGRAGRAPSPSGCPRSAGRPPSSRPTASTGRRRCGWSTAAPIPTPATPTGWTPARWPARCSIRSAPVAPARYLPVLWDLERDRAARAAPAAACRPAGSCWCRARCCRALGLAFDVVVHLRMAPAARRRRTPAGPGLGAAGLRPLRRRGGPGRAGRRRRARRPPRPARRSCSRAAWPVAGPGRAARSVSPELAGDPAVDDVAGDRDRRRQRPRPGAGAQLVAGEPARLLDLVVVDPQRRRRRRRARRSRASATAGTARAGWRRSGRR